MAINFPNSPNVNDTHSSGGKTWKWDGTSWKLNSSPATGIGYTDLSVTQVAASGTGTLAYNNGGLFTYTPPDLSGFLTSIPIAAAGTLGGVKIGSNVSVTGDGTISVATPYTLPTAGVGSGGLLGGVKVDGTTITISAGVITSVASAASQITVADETTDTSCYVVFVNDTPGGQAAKTGSLLYNAASGQLQAGSFKKASGTSSEFLKADGSIDSNTYSQSTHTHSYALNDLTNVDATTNLANGKILKYDLGSTSWVVADDNASGGGSSSFTGLSDTPSAHSNNKWLKSDGSALIWADAPVNLTIANNGNNRIVTGVTGNELHAEGNLTFDGSTLIVTGAATISTDLTVSGKILDKDGDSGTSGQILSSTGTQVNWIDAPTDTNTQLTTEEVQDIIGGMVVGNTESGITVQYSDSTGKLNFTADSSGITVQEEGTSLSTAATTINFTGAKVTASGTGATKTVDVATPTLAEVTTAGNSTTNNVTVNDLNVDGNLTVSGTTTTIDTATLNVADNLITLNSNYSGGSPTTNAGIEVNRGTVANVALRWNESTNKWQFTNDGSSYSDIGSGSASGTTNLGVTANGTSLTVTSDTGNNASIPAATTSAWGAMTDEMYDKLDGIDSSANNYTHPNHSGDVTSTGDGATTIANDAVTYAKIQNVSENRILGRNTGAGTGNVTELNPTNIRTMINVANGAEVNVQSDWNQTTTSADDFIKNKPTGLLTSVPTLTQVTTAGSSTSNNIEVGDCTVTGDLSVDGLVGVSDEKITLNSDFSGSSPSANVDVIVERGTATNVRIRWNESTNKWTATNDGSTYFDLGGGVPQYTIVMYHGSTAPSGWAICNGSNGTPDLTDKFVVAAGSTYGRTNSGGYAKPQLVEHSHNYNMTSTGSSGGGHSHSKGNFSLGTSQHNGHTHGAGNYDTGNNNTNHYHTIGANKPNGQAGVWQVNTSQNGGHSHGYQTTNSHPQSNMDGIKEEGGDGGYINNAHIQSNGSHSHTVNLSGVTTGGIDSNHTHTVSGNSGSDGDHSHNVNMNGNTNNTGTHDHSFALGDSTNNSGISAITNNSPAFNHRNLPPYYSVLFIMKL